MLYTVLATIIDTYLYEINNGQLDLKGMKSSSGNIIRPLSFNNINMIVSID